MKPPKERIKGYIMFGIIANLMLIMGAFSVDIYAKLAGFAFGCWMIGVMSVFVFVERNIKEI